MDWKIFASTFVLIFMAELGDKTQFAAMAAASTTKNIWSVGLAVVLAMTIAGILGVVAGSVLGRWLNPRFLQWFSGSLFIVIGIWILFKKPG